MKESKTGSEYDVTEIVDLQSSVQSQISESCNNICLGPYSTIYDL